MIIKYLQAQCRLLHLDIDLSNNKKKLMTIDQIFKVDQLTGIEWQGLS